MHYSTVKPPCSNFMVITPNFSGVPIFGNFTVEMHPEDADRMANGIDPDQNEQSDLGLHCLSTVCPKTGSLW